MLNQSFTENFQSTTSKSPFLYWGKGLRDLGFGKNNYFWRITKLAR
jgi:hypothetical protein